MNTAAIEQTLLHLPREARAHLAQLLLESLDELSEADARKLWAGEAGRRADEIDRGVVTLVDGDDFERQVQSLLK